jgi:YaiO family outer membrane protein
VRKSVFLFYFFFILVSIVSAQTDYNKMDVDNLFKLARETAFSGKREEARSMCRIILERSPKYNDVRVFLARTYAWDGKRDSARKELKQVLSDEPAFLEASVALIDVELWDDKPAQAEVEANTALAFNPSNEDLLIRKAKALKDQEKYEEALLVISRAEQLNPACAECAKIREQIKISNYKTTIGASYGIDYYSKVFDPMHYGLIQAGTRTKYGSIIGRINYSQRFGEQGVQPEIDLYPKIMNGVYAYLNYGFTNYNLFPRHRLGGELYSKLPKGFEASLGFRYLNFGAGSDVTIYTGSLSKYYRNYLFTLRPYITPSNGSFSRSVNFMVRRYFADADNFFSVNVGAGFSPDQKRIQTNVGLEPGNNIYFLKSQKIEFSFQKSLKSNLILILTADYLNQELSFSYDKYVNVFGFTAGIRMKL